MKTNPVFVSHDTIAYLYTNIADAHVDKAWLVWDMVNGFHLPRYLP